MRPGGFLVLALAACGRVGFDPTGGDGPGPDVGFFLGPDGDDANPGTRAAPWLTFAHAFGQLAPGGTLTLLAGNYGPGLASGRFFVDCDSTGVCEDGPCPDGEPGAPITVRADESRAAHIKTDGLTPAIDTDHCHDWSFDGLVAIGTDNPAGIGANSIRFDQSQNMTLRNSIATTPNRYGNWNGIEVNSCAGVLIEDVEVYDFHRFGISIYESAGCTIRRAYVSSRARPDVAGGYATSCPGEGDIGVSIRASGTTLVENTVVETTCRGFQIYAGTSSDATGDQAWSDDNLISGSVALGGSREGFRIETDCMAPPCTIPDELAERNVIRSSVAIGFLDGFHLIGGTANRLENVTAIDSSEHGVYAEEDGQPADFTATAASVVNAPFGGYYVRQAAWTVTGSNGFGANPNYDPLDANVVNATQDDPALGGCYVYLPASSPLAARDVGADLRVRTVDGAVTADPLWDPTTGEFPCGAIAAGVNEDPAAACRGVHTRLHVGAGGCALP